MEAIRFRANVTEVTHTACAMQHMEKAQGRYAAIIFTDLPPMEPDSVAVQEKFDHGAHRGGIVVLGFHRPSFARPDKTNEYFKDG